MASARAAVVLVILSALEFFTKVAYPNTVNPQVGSLAVAVHAAVLRTETVKSTLEAAAPHVRVTFPPASLHLLITLVAAPPDPQT